MKTEGKKKGGGISIVPVLILLLSIVAGISAWKVIGIVSAYKSQRDSYAVLDSFVDTENAGARRNIPPLGEPDSEAAGSGERKVFDVNWPKVDFKELQAINPDIIAWVYIEDTNINYPVTWCGDNSTYLNKNFRGDPTPVGCIFLEGVNSPAFDDVHSVLYGHRVNDGSMFHNITRYKQQKFYDEHPLGLLITPECNYVIEFFSGYIAQTQIESDSWNLYFEDDEAYGEWLAESLARSMFESGVVPGIGDRIITFSTCTYEYLDSRFVLHGILHPQS